MANPQYRWRTAVAAAACLVFGSASAQQPAAEQYPGSDKRVLRVCADPNSMPLSNKTGEGFENKLAELFAKQLGWSVEYTWFPQRMGFIRQTLRAKVPNSDEFKCDLVMGVPEGYELTATSKPYLRSVWAAAYLKGRGLDGVAAPEDILKLDPAKLGKLRFGIFAQTPPVDWLLRNRLIDQAVSYTRQSGDPDETPYKLLERDLAEGKIDVAFVWGPIAGYSARQGGVPGMVVVPFPVEKDIQFDFPISMGVRHADKAWRNRVDRFIDEQRDQIRALLASYGVPQLDAQGKPIK